MSSAFWLATLALVVISSSDTAVAQNKTSQVHMVHFRNNESADEDYYTVRKAANAYVCWEICKKDSRCRSARVNEKRKQCWLRDKLPSTKLRAWNYNNYASPSHKIHIGIKMSTSQKAKYDKLVDHLVKKTRRKGKEIKRYKQVSTARLCAGLCAMNGSCKSLAYRRFENAGRHTKLGKGGVCVLFSNSPKPFSENVFFSSAL
jgi:hypothetical protein